MISQSLNTDSYKPSQNGGVTFNKESILESDNREMEDIGNENVEVNMEDHPNQENSFR
jgi:hypothetical protein